MRDRYWVTERSRNSKVGPAIVTTTSKSSCPDACPLKAKGCYAKYGRLGMFWQKVQMQGKSLAEACEALIKAKGTAVRLNQAGDLPGAKGRLEAEDGWSLIKAALGNGPKPRMVWSYTHYPVLWRFGQVAKENIQVLKVWNTELGEKPGRAPGAINVSLNSLQEVDEFQAAEGKYSLPLTTLLPASAKGKRWLKTPQGSTVIVCPEQAGVKPNCLSCKLCMQPERKFVVGFLPHGSGKAAVDGVAKG